LVQDEVKKAKYPKMRRKINNVDTESPWEKEAYALQSNRRLIQLFEKCCAVN